MSFISIIKIAVKVISIAAPAVKLLWKGVKAIKEHFSNRIKVPYIPEIATVKETENIIDIIQDAKTGIYERQLEPINKESYREEQPKIKKELPPPNKEDFRELVEKIEGEFFTSAKEFFNSILENTKNECEENNIPVDFSMIKYSFNDLMKNSKGSFFRQVENGFALSNNDFSEILRIENDSERKNKLNKYVDNIIATSIKEFNSSLDEIQDSSIKMIKTEIDRLIKNREKSIARTINEIEKSISLKEDEIAIEKKKYSDRRNMLNNLISVLEE